MIKCICISALAVVSISGASSDAAFLAQSRTFYSTRNGLPGNDVTGVVVHAGKVYVRTTAGAAVFGEGQWTAVKEFPARHSDHRAVGAAAGGRAVRDVVADPKNGRMCFAAVGLAGCRTGTEWQLWSADNGLPYDDLTSVALADDGSVWLGSKIGAMRFDGKRWEYRQGLRWLPHDDVRAVAVLGRTAWFATAAGVGAIEQTPVTLGEKAKFFEDEIDRRHRRTEYGYVLSVTVPVAGDKANPVQHDSDNDGLWTAMYGAGEAFACGAGIDAGCTRAKAAFEALRFLGEVTQGGTHSPPRGYVARTILPTSGPDPNARYTPERDRQTRATRDALWKIMNPRWPKSADGKWYWKSDTSSDELDGHYFLYAAYYDLVARTDAEKQRVRDQVAALTDHLVDHNFQLIDHDGQPTRWGVFNPEQLNRNSMWAEERGLNSLSMLSYLATAAHITGNPKYADAARMLREKHSYDVNTLIAKSNAGPGSGNQSDDEMAFMCLYNLMKYEQDPRLRSLYGLALRQRWEVEEPELNPLFNFIAAVGLKDATFQNAFGTEALAPAGTWLDESLDTLRRYPLDRFNWAMKNSHRKDVKPLWPHAARSRPGIRGHSRDGRVLPIDERYVEYWNHDPWQLDYAGNGRGLADGASFLLPYYMGLYHGFITR